MSGLFKSVSSMLATYAANAGASLVGWIQAGAGATASNLQTAVRRSPISPFDFGGVGNGIADDTAAINAAAVQAIAAKNALDMTNATAWKITGRLNLTGVPRIIANFSSPINADVTGTYANAYAVEIGDPAQAFGAGRSNGTVIDGGLLVNASARTTALNGVFIKGSWLNIEHVRAVGFNGCGINQDSVWDSTTQRLSVELCGNVTTWALKLASTGDTHNASHIGSIQCEQAYHRGLFINVIRDVIHNIHSERLAVGSISDGTATYGYLNHQIQLGNSSVKQLILDCLPSGLAPDGTPPAAYVMKIKIGGDYSSVQECHANLHTIITDYGTKFELGRMLCTNYIQAGPSSRVQINGGLISGTCSAEQNVEFNEVSVGTFSPTFNGKNQVFNGGNITTVAFANNILGNISFNSASIGTVGDTKTVGAGYKPATFNDCNITTFNGAFGAMVRVNDSYVATVALASQALARFFNCDFDVFGYTGNSGFLTVGCKGPSGATWTTPLNVNYPAGTMTERVGYNAAGKVYQNTDSLLTWLKLI